MRQRGPNCDPANRCGVCREAMSHTWRLALAVTVAAVVGCVDALLAPAPASREQVGPLRLTGPASAIDLTVGDTVRLVFRLENVGDTVVHLTFPGGCQLLPYVMDRRSGAFRYPYGGQWVCTGALSYLSLAPGQAESLDVGIRRGAPQQAIYTEVPLDPGDYFVYVTLAHPDYPLRSSAVGLRIR